MTHQHMTAPQSWDQWPIVTCDTALLRASYCVLGMLLDVRVQVSYLLERNWLRSPFSLARLPRSNLIQANTFSTAAMRLPGDGQLRHG